MVKGTDINHWGLFAMYCVAEWMWQTPSSSPIWTECGIWMSWDTKWIFSGGGFMVKAILLQQIPQAIIGKWDVCTNTEWHLWYIGVYSACTHSSITNHCNTLLTQYFPSLSNGYVISSWHRPGGWLKDLAKQKPEGCWLHCLIGAQQQECSHPHRTNDMNGV